MAAKQTRSRRTARFGTAPVFLTAISTILGAIMFLRFGWAVGNVGFLGTVAIITIGHLVTIPTAMALSEIATNQRVEGGGEYFIISRSFGAVPGATIGMALFFSQAISVAFYVIAFAEAFTPLLDMVRDRFGLVIEDRRLISGPALALLAVAILLRGANLGVRILYVVVTILAASLVLVFLGNGTDGGEVSYSRLLETAREPAPFFLVFAICFPAFTGMTAGVGLSGDLRDPRRSIPIGTMAATLIGMFVYIALAYKLATSASPAELVNEQLVMGRIALWGPIVPIGLAAATISSALGSALVAPRTLQALAEDGVAPTPGLAKVLAHGRGATREPTAAAVLVFALAALFVLLGNVDFVAQVISMFFMVTYGSICLISFLEHFAGDPSYRPLFRSRWYVSLFGAAMCVWLMFRMSPAYALISITVMVLLYLAIRRLLPERQGLARIVRGAMFQLSRRLHVLVQKSSAVGGTDSWRPSVVCMSEASFDRLDAFELLRWISFRYGFGTYIHLIEDYLSAEAAHEARDTLQRLVRLAEVSESNVYVDTLLSPSYTSAISQIVQLPGISGQENNMLLLEYRKDDAEALQRLLQNYRLVVASDFDVALLATGSRGFGYHREVHVWITPADYENANLMILLGYVTLGHPDWRAGRMTLLAFFPGSELEQQRKDLEELVQSGRLPVSMRNIELVPQEQDVMLQQAVRERSRDADLIIVGFVAQQVRRRPEAFAGFDGVGNVLFVNTNKEIDISDESAEGTTREEPAETAAQESGKAAGDEREPAASADGAAGDRDDTDADTDDADAEIDDAAAGGSQSGEDQDAAETGGDADSDSSGGSGPAAAGKKRSYDDDDDDDDDDERNK